jgi:hypothetical protein
LALALALLLLVAVRFLLRKQPSDQALCTTLLSRVAGAVCGVVLLAFAALFVLARYDLYFGLTFSRMEGLVVLLAVAAAVYEFLGAAGERFSRARMPFGYAGMAFAALVEILYYQNPYVQQNAPEKMAAQYALLAWMLLLLGETRFALGRGRAVQRVFLGGLSLLLWANVAFPLLAALITGASVAAQDPMAFAILGVGGTLRSLGMLTARTVPVTGDVNGDTDGGEYVLPEEAAPERDDG